MQFFKNYVKKDYLEEPYIKKDPNGKEYIKDKTSFEFFRYHSLDKKTFDNLFQLHYGYQKYRVKEALKKKVNEFDQNKPQKSLFNNFKDAGYIVAHAMNTCSSKCILRGFASKNQYKFKDEPADHELMILDPMYINRQNYFDTTKGINSIYRRCLYQKDTNEFAFEYGKQFLNQYRDENKVLYLEFTDGHEITSEVVQYIDDPMYKFLTDIEKDGHLQKDTMLYLLSDHGQHLVSAFYLFNQIKAQNEEDEINDVYQTERMLPMFYMLVTNDLLKKHNDIAQNLESNSQSIFGMSELRETFLQNSFGIEKRKEMKKKEIENQNNLIIYQNKKNQYALKQNPDAIVEELEFVKKEAEFSIFQKLDDSRSCYDIGMTQLENPERFCSCKPQKKIE
ncbi:Alkaline-phosphatase-like, core domain [Pseudocohnilembus persalinus]|uniref:Alkaline-phosphatase-like, core domain n=1 Tax=Pseudocohnilembus persalinus TaxID=266149 RepID=A0A0V0QLN1_PSEPJ|nr:Alkaline-phosphatase-like, core domain [Pseudocohnilembus persalinus]|eukprot:KRX03124.1 Alkaline-phosphatase-like, core domain [Pseudocohnilembus persalinus]